MYTGTVRMPAVRRIQAEREEHEAEKRWIAGSCRQCTKSMLVFSMCRIQAGAIMSLQLII